MALTAHDKTIVRRVARGLRDAYDRGEDDSLSETVMLSEGYADVHIYPDDRDNVAHVVRAFKRTARVPMGGRLKVAAKRKAGAKTSARKKVPAKRVANPRGKAKRRNPDDGFPFVSLDGNMSPATQAKLRTLVKARAPASYPIQAHSGSADAMVLRRRKVLVSGHGEYGKNRYSITKTRLPGLLIAMARSGREDEYDLASAILSSLDIELV